MVTLLHQPALLQHQDAITGRRRRELVADHQHRALALLADRAQDFRCRGVVDAGQGIVEHQQRRLQQQGPPKGGALALAAAEGDAPLAHQGVVAIGEALDIPLQAGLAGCCLHLLHGGIRIAVAEVVGQAGGEQEALLGH